jgi:hypothetical protein
VDPGKEPAVKRIAIFASALACALALASPARADRRIFAFTYPYMTLPKGSFELEHYLDLGLNNWDNPSTPEKDSSWATRGGST